MIFPAFSTLHGNFCGRLPSDFLRSALYPSTPYPRQSPNGYLKIYLLEGLSDPFANSENGSSRAVLDLELMEEGLAVAGLPE